METVKCRDCGKDVSKSSMSCPNCGAFFPANPDWNGWGINYKSRTEILNKPLIHIAFGIDKERKLRVADGIIAIGQFAKGYFVISQFGIAYIFGFGQFILSPLAIAQIAVGIIAVGQIAIGAVAVGQFALGYMIFCQLGFGKFAWSIKSHDIEAYKFFYPILHWVKSIFLK